MEMNGIVQELYEQILAPAPQFTLEELAEQTFLSRSLVRCPTGRSSFEWGGVASDSRRLRRRTYYRLTEASRDWVRERSLPRSGRIP